MGLLSRGQEMLNRRLFQSEAVVVVYTRKGHEPIQVLALIARTLFSGLVESSVSVQWGERDYLIQVKDLILSGSPTTPQRGDRITQDGVIFELSTPQTEEPPWRYSDAQRTLFRCHTKWVG